MDDELDDEVARRQDLPWLGADLPPAVLDDKGRWVRPPRQDRVPEREVVDGRVQVDRFLTWLRTEGWTGDIALADLLEFYGWFCAEAALVPLRERDLLDGLAAARGVNRFRTRIKGTPRFRLIVHSMRARGLKLEKVVVYAIAPLEEIAANDDCPKARRERSRKPRPVRPGIRAAPVSVAA